MEAFFLTCVVVAFFVTKGRTDTAAYNNGKEPPGLARARMRHAAAGGARTATGRPVGRGAFGLLMASRWAGACRAAQHRAARRRAWFDDTAPQRDARWRDTQRRRLDRADRARARWAAARGLPTSTGTGGTGGTGGGTDDSGGGRLWPNRARRRATRPPTDTPDTGAVPGATTDTGTGGAGGADEGADQHERPAVTDVTDVTGGEGRARAGVTGTTETAEPGGAKTAEPDTGGAADPAVVSGLSDLAVSTPRKGSTEMDEQYEAAVARLTAAAEEIAVFAANLAGFTDRLAGDGWGAEVTGPLAECGPVLSAWEASYRSTAAAMKAQGGAGRDAYDQAPFVPGPHAVLT